MAGRYFNLGLEQQVESGQAVAGACYAGAIIEFNQKLLLSEHEEGLGLPQISLPRPQGLRASVANWLDQSGVRVTLGSTYSIFDDAGSADHHSFFRAEAENEQTCGLGNYYPIEDLPDLKFVSPAIQSMLERYAFEFQSRSFGLYLGDECEGDLFHYQPGY